jgi:hypothetical protein
MKKILCFILFISTTTLLSAQLSSSFNNKRHLSQLKESLQKDQTIFYFTPQIQHLDWQQFGNQTSTHLKTAQQKMPLAYAYKDLAFFCKIEVQLEKNVKLPVKFRLGSVDYVDYLEGKRRRY